MKTRLIVRGARAGFSLLELMLVVAIIGVLMAVVAVNVLGQGDRAKRTATLASMDTIHTALKSYHLQYSSYPPDLTTLISTKYLDPTKPLRDGWKHDFAYDPRGRNTDQPFILGSPGPDGTLGNEDDIDIWTAARE